MFCTFILTRDCW